MKMKKLGTLALALTLALSLAMPAFAATPAVVKAVTKTLTYNTFDSAEIVAPATLSVTNVTKTETKDFSTYLSDDKLTIEGKKSQVLTCKAPVTVTLMPNKGQKTTGYFSYSVSYDGSKIPAKSVTKNIKYYGYNYDTGVFDYKKKLTIAQAKAIGSWGVADTSTLKLTKPGTYVIWAAGDYDIDPDTAMPVPVFVVVK